MGKGSLSNKIRETREKVGERGRREEIRMREGEFKWKKKIEDFWERKMSERKLLGSNCLDDYGIAKKLTSSPSSFLSVCFLSLPLFFFFLLPT